MITHWCTIEGHGRLFPLRISPTGTIYDLQGQIYNKGSNHFIGCDLKDLTPTKVCYIRVSMHTLI